MANAFTGGASGAAWDLLTETAYDRAVEYYLRDEPQWLNVIDTHPVAPAMPGEVITMTLHNPIANLATTPLTETVDPDAVALVAPSRVLITMQEWGNATLSTLRLRELAFTKPDTEKVELLGRNMYDSMDAIVQAVADAGTNVLHENSGVLTTQNSGSPGTDVLTTTTDLLQRKAATTAVAVLRRNKVWTKQAGKYVSIIHSDVAFDLQAENSQSAWNAPHTLGGDTEAIYSGTIGDFMGARYIETTRCNITTGAASGAKLYSTYYFGRQALVSAVDIAPHIVVGPQVDKLKRFFPLGWYALAGFSIYRPQALLTVKTQSSISTL